MGKRNENSDLKKIKLETGTVYQTEKGGNYYFRYQIRGDRKCVSLNYKTHQSICGSTMEDENCQDINIRKTTAILVYSAPMPDHKGLRLQRFDG
jgi:hypothetical protein